VEPADDRIDPPPERQAPSRPYREASLCDVVMFFSLSRFGCLKSPVSVSSRRSRIASALSLVLASCNATLGPLASGVRPIESEQGVGLPIVPVLGRLKPKALALIF